MRRARFAGRPSGLQIPDEPLQINGDLLEDSAIQPVAIIRRATQEERLQLGDAIVQCISGNTGTPLASVAVALGFECLVFSNASSGKSYRTCQSARNGGSDSHLMILHAGLVLFH